MTHKTREVFVLENNGNPTRATNADGAGQLALEVEAGVRLGIPTGQERVVRYVPEHANLWLFQANENWTETQLTNTGPVQPLLRQDVDGAPWTFSLYFIAPDWDAAKRLMDVMQGHRVGSYVEHVAPEPKSLNEHRGKSASRYVPGKPKHRWNWLKFDDPRYAAWARHSENITNVTEIKVCKRCGQVVRMVRARYGTDRHKMVREHLAPGSDLGPPKWLRGHKVCVP